MDNQPITYEQLETAFKRLVGEFIRRGFTKDEAIAEATRALKNGDFEKMIKQAIIESK